MGRLLWVVMLINRNRNREIAVSVKSSSVNRNLTIAALILALADASCSDFCVQFFLRRPIVTFFYFKGKRVLKGHSASVKASFSLAQQEASLQ